MSRWLGVVAVVATLGIGQIAAAQTVLAPAPRENRLPPARVAGLPATTDIDGANVLGTTMCAVADGEVWCWGDCRNGICGKETTGERAQHEPRKVRGLRSITSVSVGSWFACAVDDKRRVWCWGQLYDAMAKVRSPRRVRALPASTQVSVDSALACALGVDGRVRCWGVNYNGELGQGPVLVARGKSKLVTRVGREASGKPLVVRGVDDAVAISVGDHACAIRRGGDVVCWGNARRDDQTIVRDGSVHAISLPAPATSISSAYHQTCAALEGGGIACWSFAYDGLAIAGPATCERVKAAASIDDHGSYAVLESGDLVELDLHASDYCRSAKRLKDVPASVESAANCARTAAGAVWCWGTNEHGQTGRKATPRLVEGEAGLAPPPP